MALSLHMPPSTPQPVGAQLRLWGPSENWSKWYKGSMAAGNDNYASKNVLYTISKSLKFGIILIHASEYSSTSGSTAGSIEPIEQLNYMIQGFYGSWNSQLWFSKCIIHNIHIHKIRYYFYTCLQVPFNQWDCSWSHQACQTIYLHNTRVLWQLQLTIMHLKMCYTQYPDPYNMALFWYLHLSTLQPHRPQLLPLGLLDNWFTWYNVSMPVGTDNYAFENSLYAISRPIKYGIIFIHASKYYSTGGSTTGAIRPIGQLISIIQGFYSSWNWILLSKMQSPQYSDPCSRTPLLLSLTLAQSNGFDYSCQIGMPFHCQLCGWSLPGLPFCVVLF